MAKRGRRSNNKPQQSYADFVPGSDPVAATESSETVVQTVRVTLQLPLMLPKPGEDKARIRHIQVQNLGTREQAALRALYDALVFEGAHVQTSLSRPVQHIASDPVRYMLQALAEAMPE